MITKNINKTGKSQRVYVPGVKIKLSVTYTIPNRIRYC